MPTVKAESKDKKIECFYDPNYDNSTFMLMLPHGSTFVAVRVDKYEIDNLIDTLRDFDVRMRFAGAIK